MAIRVKSSNQIRHEIIVKKEQLMHTYRKKILGNGHQYIFVCCSIYLAVKA